MKKPTMKMSSIEIWLPNQFYDTNRPTWGTLIMPNLMFETALLIGGYYLKQIFIKCAIESALIGRLLKGLRKDYKQD